MVVDVHGACVPVYHNRKRRWYGMQMRVRGRVLPGFPTSLIQLPLLLHILSSAPPSSHSFLDI